MSTFTQTIPDPKLEALLARLCQRLSHLWTMQAVRLPYLVDLVAFNVLGQEITKTQHKAWTQGVVTARVWGLMRYGEGGDYFEVTKFPDGSRRLSLRSGDPPSLTRREREIVDFVADEYGRLSGAALGDLTKEINPGEEWGGETPVSLTKESYRLLPAWFGEKEAEEKVLQKRLREIKRDPDRLLRREEVDTFLNTLAH